MTTFDNKQQLIEARLRKAFAPTYLEVIDESDAHIGHAGHQGGGRHFAIIIAAPLFQLVSRVEAHRQIYDLFKDLMPNEIHALRIVIRTVKSSALISKQEKD